MYTDEETSYQQYYRRIIHMYCSHLSRFVVVLAAAAFVFSMAGSDAIAAKESKAEKILERVSKESHTAVRDVRFARVAIFDGQSEDAEKYLADAKKNLAEAEKQAPKYIVTVKAKQQVGSETVGKRTTTQTSDFVPIDAWLVLSEDFISTPEKKAKIEEANKHLKKGDSAKAVTILREADIGISVTHVLMPLNATIKLVDKAIAMLKDHKYYEANLVLKGIEDGLIMDTVSLYEPVKPEKK